MHYTWQWSYTVYSFVALLALFGLVGAALLVRRLSPRARWHRSPDSLVTPLGYAEGIERARTREYFVKGRD